MNIIHLYELVLFVASSEGPISHGALSWDYIWWFSLAIGLPFLTSGLDGALSQYFPHHLNAWHNRAHVEAAAWDSVPGPHFFPECFAFRMSVILPCLLPLPGLGCTAEGFSEGVEKEPSCGGGTNGFATLPVSSCTISGWPWLEPADFLHSSPVIMCLHF